jgi:hypothetical protein
MGVVFKDSTTEKEANRRVRNLQIQANKITKNPEIYKPH